jgi:hypothetical protein
LDSRCPAEVSSRICSIQYVPHPPHGRRSRPARRGDHYKHATNLSQFHAPLPIVPITDIEHIQKNTEMMEKFRNRTVLCVYLSEFCLSHT